MAIYRYGDHRPDIGRECYISDSARVIGFDVVIGSWSIVAEGCVVPQSSTVPDGRIAGGVPFSIIGDVKKKHKVFWTYAKQLYVDLAKEYPQKFEQIG